MSLKYLFYYSMKLTITTVGFSTLIVLDDELPDAAPATDADALPIVDVID